MAWRALLTHQERAELELAEYYASCLRHGTDGHHRLLLLAKLARALDRATGLVASPDANARGELASSDVSAVVEQHGPLREPQPQDPCR